MSNDRAAANVNESDENRRPSEETLEERLRRLEEKRSKGPDDPLSSPKAPTRNSTHN